VASPAAITAPWLIKQSSVPTTTAIVTVFRSVGLANLRRPASGGVLHEGSAGAVSRCHLSAWISAYGSARCQRARSEPARRSGSMR
jgi:hypothetical protein